MKTPMNLEMGELYLIFFHGFGSTSERYEVGETKGYLKIKKFLKTFRNSTDCRGSGAREIIFNEYAVYQLLAQALNPALNPAGESSIGQGEENEKKNSLSAVPAFFCKMFAAVEGGILMGVPYLLMDYFYAGKDGGTLAEAINVEDNFSTEKKSNLEMRRDVAANAIRNKNIGDLVRYIRQAAEQAHAYHNVSYPSEGDGIIHSDINPHNIHLVRENSSEKRLALLADFGLAREKGASIKNLFNGTSAKGIGNSYYGSSELGLHNRIYSPLDIAGDDQAEPSYDVYSLANLLCLAVTGKLSEHWRYQMHEEKLDGLQWNALPAAEKEKKEYLDDFVSSYRYNGEDKEKEEERLKGIVEKFISTRDDERNNGETSNSSKKKERLLEELVLAVPVEAVANYIGSKIKDAWKHAGGSIPAKSTSLLAEVISKGTAPKSERYQSAREFTSLLENLALPEEVPVVRTLTLDIQIPDWLDEKYKELHKGSFVYIPSFHTVMEGEITGIHAGLEKVVQEQSSPAASVINAVQAPFFERALQGTASRESNIGLGTKIWRFLEEDWAKTVEGVRRNANVLLLGGSIAVFGGLAGIGIGYMDHNRSSEQIEQHSDRRVPVPAQMRNDKVSMAAGGENSKELEALETSTKNVNPKNETKPASEGEAEPTGREAYWTGKSVSCRADFSPPWNFTVNCESDHDNKFSVNSVYYPNTSSLPEQEQKRAAAEGYFIGVVEGNLNGSDVVCWPVRVRYPKVWDAKAKQWEAGGNLQIDDAVPCYAESSVEKK